MAQAKPQDKKKKKPADHPAAASHEHGRQADGGKLSPHVATALYALSRASVIFARVADRFSVVFVVLVLLLGVVWKFGSAQTQNDFVRELLFQETSKKPYVALFFGGLVLLNLLVAAVNWFRSKPAEQKEISRVLGENERLRQVADEKSKLQEQILGVPLNHTDGEVVPSQKLRVPPVAGSTTEAEVGDHSDTDELDEASKRGRERES